MYRYTNTHICLKFLRTSTPESMPLPNDKVHRKQRAD